MRPSANFTLHAILAACLVAFAASSAAAQSPPTLRIVTETPMAAKGDKPRIAVLELQAVRWGTIQDPKQYGEWIADVERPAAGGGGGNQLRMEDSAGGADKQRQAGFSGRGVDIAAIDGQPVATGASGRVTGIASDPADAASGLPTGKRQHKPFVLAKPLDKGSVWVRVASPWTACRVGTRYPALELSDGGRNYRLEGVSVANCGRSGAQADRPTEEIAFYYNKISF